MLQFARWSIDVTPCVGVWIETYGYTSMMAVSAVTPCVGVWIETLGHVLKPYPLQVTPCVGVWIETLCCNLLGALLMSHPAWVCGLKHVLYFLGNIL